MTSKLEFSEKKPLLLKISEWEDQYLIDNFYAKQSVEELEKRIVELGKSRVKIAAPTVQSFEQSRSAAKKATKAITDSLEDPILKKWMGDNVSYEERDAMKGGSN